MAGVWAIDGVEVPASVARMLAYVAGGGAEGIVEPGGLKVQPLAVPGTSVRVMPGAAMVKNRYPGGSLQSYPIYEQVQQTVPIVATGSGGGRADLVIARVRDPQYVAGAAGVTFEVIQGVPASSGAAYVESLAYPALALARVTIPASTATITAGMITDLRALARPRTSLWRRSSTAPGTGSLTSTTRVRWPNIVHQVPVPSWATHVNVKADISGAYAGGSAAANLFVSVGTSGVSSSAAIDTSTAARLSSTVVGDFALNATDRAAGTIAVEMQGNKYAGGNFLADHATPVAFDLLFEERAV